MISKIDNFLDDDLLLESKKYADDMLFTPHLSAHSKSHTLGIREEFVEYGIDLFHVIDKKSDLFLKLQSNVSSKSDITPTKIGISYMLAGSSLKWHRDILPMTASVTIYLNDEWNKNWGGLFLYTEEDEITNEVQAIFPKDNLAILKDSYIWHSVSPTSKNSLVRISLQMFQEIS